MMPKPNWEARMIYLADHWRQYSTCVRRQVGAVIYDPNTKAIISMGYNDCVIGQKNCGDGGCPKCLTGEPTRDNLECLCAHAEMNAVVFAARTGAPLEGSHIAVCDIPPCIGCTKYLYHAGIAKVVVGSPKNIESLVDYVLAS